MHGNRAFVWVNPDILGDTLYLEATTIETTPLLKRNLRDLPVAQEHWCRGGYGGYEGYGYLGCTYRLRYAGGFSMNSSSAERGIRERMTTIYDVVDRFCAPTTFAVPACGSSCRLFVQRQRTLL